MGDPGIEPGMSHLGGVTVRCRTLQPVPRCGVLRRRSRLLRYGHGLGLSTEKRPWWGSKRLAVEYSAEACFFRATGLSVAKRRV